jgi:hypothetical protein
MGGSAQSPRMQNLRASGQPPQPQPQPGAGMPGQPGQQPHLMLENGMYMDPFPGIPRQHTGGQPQPQPGPPPPHMFYNGGAAGSPPGSNPQDMAIYHRTPHPPPLVMHPGMGEQPQDGMMGMHAAMGPPGAYPGRPPSQPPHTPRTPANSVPNHASPQQHQQPGQPDMSFMHPHAQPHMPPPPARPLSQPPPALGAHHPGLTRPPSQNGDAQFLGHHQSSPGAQPQLYATQAGPSRMQPTRQPMMAQPPALRSELGPLPIPREALQNPHIGAPGPAGQPQPGQQPNMRMANGFPQGVPGRPGTAPGPMQGIQGWPGGPAPPQMVPTQSNGMHQPGAPMAGPSRTSPAASPAMSGAGSQPQPQLPPPPPMHPGYAPGAMKMEAPPSAGPGAPPTGWPQSTPGPATRPPSAASMSNGPAPPGPAGMPMQPNGQPYPMMRPGAPPGHVMMPGMMMPPQQVINP